MFPFCSIFVHASRNKFEYVHAGTRMVNPEILMLDGTSTALYRGRAEAFFGEKKPMKFQLAAIVIAGFLATAAHAGEPIDPERIASATTGDWDGDGDIDLAMLVRPAQDQGTAKNAIYILFNDPLSGSMEVKALANDKVEGDFIYVGNEATISALPNGSILVSTKNGAEGQRHYEQKLTLAYRNFQFVVAGYTFTRSDDNGVENFQSCDLNVLTGKGKRDDAPFSVAPRFTTIEDWNDEMGTQSCNY